MTRSDSTSAPPEAKSGQARMKAASGLAFSAICPRSMPSRPSSFSSETMKVFIPSPLRSYTEERNQVEADGATLAEVLADLDRRYPGIRFRMIDEQDTIRRHIRIWVNQDQVRALDVPLRGSDEVIILQALSGG